tara:strand:+ start:7795 stop:8040 length:246 start_codon:yes stop_codon:yes gene_type:complete
MTEKEILLERRKIEKLFKRTRRDYKEIKSSLYNMYRNVGVPLKLKKKLKAQVDYTLFNMSMDYDTFKDTVGEILTYLGQQN